MWVIYVSLWLSAFIGLYSCEKLQISGNNECYMPRGGCSETNCSYGFYTCDDSPTVTYLEPSNSTVKVKFQHPQFDCCLGIYTVFLLVNEELINETTCNANSTEGVWTVHSLKPYHINKCDNTTCNGSACEEFGEVKFGYVFSGCYKLRIEINKNGSTLRPLGSCPHYIRTNYIKSAISGPLILSSTYYYKERQLKIGTFPNFTFMRMYIEVEIQDSRGGHHPHSMCILHNGGTESNPDLSVVNQVNGTCKHNSTNCVYFTAEKVPAGNYSITVIVDDDRCDPRTLWTKYGHCKWTYSALGNVSDDVPVVSVTNKATIWIILSIVVIIVHVVVCICVIIRRKSKPTTPVPSEYTPLRPKNNYMNVLLLYPRDCFDFMNTMSSFRRLLERFDNVEVLDCHTTKDELHDPLDWLRKVMNFPRLYIIVVTSHCAFMQQEAIQSGSIENCYIIYRNPSFLDHVFPYGLRQLMNDFSPNVYQKIHIIGFRSFSEDDKMLSLPSSLRRYNIPEHLNKLFLEMHLELSHGGQIHDTAEYLSLQNNIQKLRNYKSKNPDYLNEILNMNRS